MAVYILRFDSYTGFVKIIKGDRIYARGEKRIFTDVTGTDL